MFKKVISIIIVLFMVLPLSAGFTEKKSSPVKQPKTKTCPYTELVKKEKKNSDGFLVWNIAVDPQTWDPTLNSQVYVQHLINNMFEGLTRVVNGVDVAPGMAVKWDISDDLKTYTFHLRDGLKWSDGKPLTAHDFEYSWKRGCDSAVASDYTRLFTENIVGAEEFFNKTGSRDDLGVKALDDKTFEVKLKFPVPYLLNLTSLPAFNPVRQDIIEAKPEGWEKNPATCISNGPFKLAKYKAGSHITFIKNENYWAADKIKLKGIIALMIQDGTLALNAYDNGEIQILDSISIPIEQIPRLQKEDPNFAIVPHMGTSFLTFNVDNPVLKDIRIRKAFSLAIDRTLLVQQVTKAGQIPATGFIPIGMNFSDNTSIRKLDANGIAVPEYGIDPNRALVYEARKLLADAGYPNGKGLPEITFVYNTNENNKKIAEAFQKMWKQNLGVEVKLVNQDWDEFFETKINGEYMIARGGWLGDYGDPMALLELFTLNSGSNESQWRYKEEPVVAPHDKNLNSEQEAFENAIIASRSASGKDRDKLLKEAEDVLMNNMVVAPIFYYPFTRIIDGDKVKGVELTKEAIWDFRHAEMVD